MWALSLTKSHGESINELSKWILADQSNRQKLLWRYFTHSNAPARQWMLDFAAALENGERPPDLPEGLPVLFSHVPKSKELQSEMHDPVIYAVVAEASRERGPNEAVGEAVKRARDEGIDLNPLTLMLVYVGIARGVKAFIGRYQGYLVRRISSYLSKSDAGAFDRKSINIFVRDKRGLCSARPTPNPTSPTTSFRSRVTSFFDGSASSAFPSESRKQKERFSKEFRHNLWELCALMRSTSESWRSRWRRRTGKRFWKWSSDSVESSSLRSEKQRCKRGRTSRAKYSA